MQCGDPRPATASCVRCRELAGNGERRLKDELCIAAEHDLLIRSLPGHADEPTRRAYLDRTLRAATEDGRRGDRARAGAATQRLTDAALEDARGHSARADAGDFHVGA